MISASADEVLRLARGWSDSKARIRFVASLKSGAIAFECSILSVTPTEIGLRVSGQLRGVATIRLSDCEFFFGAEDIPESEREDSKFRFDTGLSVITADCESLWLLEVLEGPN